MKRMLILADFHCGHVVGLTPPRWQTQPPEGKNLTKREKYAKIQKEAWAWYLRTVTKNGPYDIIVINGDCIEGKGTRSGGTELITTDREEQCNMAKACIQRAMPKRAKDCKVVMTYGTPYHTGVDEDWENQIADAFGAKIGSHEWIDMEGVVFDFKHFVSSSSIPHGRSTPLDREALWNMIWADSDYTPRADVLVRSHVHYHKTSGDVVRPRLRLTTHALQAMGSKWGGRKCSGLVTFGLHIFETNRGDITRYDSPQAILVSQRAKAIKV